jgi:hypothetical protein
VAPEPRIVELGPEHLGVDERGRHDLVEDVAGGVVASVNGVGARDGW